MKLVAWLGAARGLEQLRAEAGAEAPRLLAPWTDFVDSALQGPVGVRVFEGEVYVAESTGSRVTAWPEIPPRELAGEAGHYTPLRDRIRFPDVAAANATDVVVGPESGHQGGRFGMLGDTVSGVENPEDVAVMRLENGHRGVYVAEGAAERVTFWQDGLSVGYKVAGLNQCDALEPPKYLYCRRRSPAANTADELDLRTLGRPVGVDLATETVAGKERVFIFVSDAAKHRVTRWRQQASGGLGSRQYNKLKKVTVVAGSADEAKGNKTSELQDPRGIAVDAGQNVYVADSGNHRVVKWAPGATEGVVVAGEWPESEHGARRRRRHNYAEPEEGYSRAEDPGNAKDIWGEETGQKIFIPKSGVEGLEKVTARHKPGRCCVRGSGLSQLNTPSGVALYAGDVYVADRRNNRVVRWGPNAKTGVLIAEVHEPLSLSVNGTYPLTSIYVVDGERRLQEFVVNEHDPVIGADSSGEDPLEHD